MMFLAALLALLAQSPEPPRPDCEAANSVETTIAEIHRQPARYLDQCVRVSGLFAGIRMYDSRDGIYLTGRLGSDGNSIPANLHHRIGIDNQEMRNLRLRAPTRATVTGRVDSCERRYQRVLDAGGIPFLAGYCHYEGGPTIVVSHYRLNGGRYERLAGEAARLRFGNIARLPADWRHRAMLESLAADFLAALQRRARARMAELHDFRADTGNEHDQVVLAMLLAQPDSPFAQLRETASPQMAIFVTNPGGSPVADENVSGILCFCRAADCTDRWPIALIDVDNAPDRPYACTRVVPRDWTRGGAGLDTPVSQRGFLAEPAATAFRH
jgi:hypothetical protein